MSRKSAKNNRSSASAGETTGNEHKFHEGKLSSSTILRRTTGNKAIDIRKRLLREAGIT
jgi:hypothetical protein